jgi:hypothetical protein
MAMQQSPRSKGYKKVLGDDCDKASGDSGIVRVIPSIGNQVKATDGNKSLTSSCEVRGSNFVGQLVCCEQVVNKEGHVTTSLLVAPNPVALEVGPGRAIQTSGPHVSSGAVNVDLDSEKVINSELGPKKTMDQRPSKSSGGDGVQMAKGHMIDNFDLMVQNSHGSNGGERVSCEPDKQLTESGANDPHTPLSKLKKTRRATTPFPSLLGPKCLRFAEVIGNSRRMTSEIASLSVESQIQSSSSVAALPEMGEKVDALVDKGCETDLEEVQQQQSPEMELTVCLPFHTDQTADSGIQHLLNEDSLKNVDGFIEARESPRVIELEATKLVEDQLVLGVNFNTEEVPIERMVKMEARDKHKLQLNQEPNGFQ